MSCAICEGPIPNALEEGEYPGALTKFLNGYNGYELCSICGDAEGMAWNFGNRNIKWHMIWSIEYQDWQAWKDAVLSHINGKWFANTEVE